MDPSSNPVSMLVFLAATAALLGGMLAFSAWLGPRRRHPVKDEPFECGIADPAPLAHRVSVKFFVTGLLFLVFDVEIAFLFPWAVIVKALGAPVFWLMAVFLLVLGAGLAYVWKRGALEWD